MKRVLIVTLLIAFVLAMANAPAPAATKPVTMGITLISFYNPFFVALKDGAKEAIAKTGGVLLEHDSQQDVARQIAAVEGFIAKKVDVILINAVDSKGLIPAVEAANRAGIPVVTVDNDVSGGTVATLVASDNVLAGELAGKYLVARLKQDKGSVAGNVVILDALPVTGVLQRLEGFNKVIKQYPGIKVVAKQNAQGNRADGLTVMENVLQAQKKIDAVFAINDPSGLGALAAIEAAGRSKEMFVMGVDGAKDALTAIKNKTAFVFTAAQFPRDIGRMGVEAGLKVLKGQKLPRFTPVPVQPVTIKDVDKYLQGATF